MPHDPGSLPLNTFRPRASPCGQSRTMQSTNEQRDFRPFIPECAKRGIGKTKAYELADAGLLETFPIGTQRYVYLASLLTLPPRIAATQWQDCLRVTTLSLTRHETPWAPSGLTSHKPH